MTAHQSVENIKYGYTGDNLVPSLHYRFSVNGFNNVTTKKMNAKAMKLVKSWLGFARSATVVIIHHPAVLDIPSISELTTKAKLAYLARVHLSPDPLIEESHLSLSL